MKKTIMTIALLAIAISAGAQDKGRETAYKREGKTFVQSPKKRASRASEDIATAYVWRDSKGNEYPIFLHTYTRGEKAGRTTAYVIRTSAKTGKEYKYYLPDGEAVAQEILAETR